MSTLPVVFVGLVAVVLGLAVFGTLVLAALSPLFVALERRPAVAQVIPVGRA